MKRSFYLISVFFIFASGVPVHAQDQEMGGMLQGLRRRALILDISARVLEEQEVVVWNENHRKFAIPGSPVGIKLVGSNIIVAVQFTPIIRRDGNILVAQGQIWIEDPEQGIVYYTSIQTIPMEFDEPIYFFPLGTSRQLNPSIEIMLTVNMYNETTLPAEISENP
jgi:hypothetical protein